MHAKLTLYTRFKLGAVSIRCDKEPLWRAGVFTVQTTSASSLTTGLCLHLSVIKFAKRN